jgi:hypothetical protein
MFVENLENRALLAGDSFHNFVMPEDADASGFVTPLDALVVINELNARSPGMPSDSNSATSRMRPDVDADQAVTPLDVLVVINALNAQNGTGANGMKTSQVGTERRIQRIEQAIEMNSLPPELNVEEAQVILETLRKGGRPELGDRVENGALRWGQEDSPISDDRMSVPDSETQEFNSLIYAVSQRLEAFNVSPFVIQKISLEIRQADSVGTPLGLAEVRSRLSELGVDVDAIMPVPSATPDSSSPVTPLPSNPTQPGHSDELRRPDQPGLPEPPITIALMVTEPVAVPLLERLVESGVAEEIIKTISKEIWDAIRAERPLDMLYVRTRLIELGA